MNTFFPGHIRFMIESLLPDLAEKLGPYRADFTAPGGAEFGDYLAKRSDEMAEAMLQVTDARAAAAGRPAVVKVYGTVRDSAGKHIAAALPNVGRLVQKYAG